MTLTSGTRLGPYEVQSPLGAGGMGEVYRATDTRLDRTVAIKVLASHLSSSPELKQRMEREARTISSLNHPHICHLYDIGSQDGTDYLVMEFLEGKTLAERLRKGAMPLNEVFKVGIAVAEALAIAHRSGIVHRDLKPGNIMLTKTGAKLMDFGLAKPLGVQTSASASAPSFTAAATLSGPSPLTPLTTAGSIIGTIQYMSPEQIEGKEADARSDIFAFGAVLYEMATGQRPFEGKSQISLAPSILEKDPEPVSAIKPSTPPAFEHVLTTCLQKNPEDRSQTAHDIKLELQWIAADRSLPAAAASPQAPSNTRERLGWAIAMVVVIAVALALVAGSLLHHFHPSEKSIRAVINPPDKTTLNLTGDAAGPLVFSPDGASIAFAATGEDGKTALWIRSMNSLDARALPGTDSAIFPFWSPDSRSLGFFADGQLKTIDLNGDSVQAVCAVQIGRGGAWGPDGVIIFSAGPSTPLMRVSAGGGTPTILTKIDPAQHTSHRWPDFLPDGKHFLYLAIHHDPSKSANNTLYYASLDGRENRPLFHSQSNAIYANGYLLFARGDQLMAQPFDPTHGTLSGEPQGVTVGEEITNLQVARISPQGDRIALQIDSGMNDIWVLDLARGVRTRLTFGPVANAYPTWSPDGKWIAYMSKRGDQFGLYRKRSDGSGAEEVLLSADAQIAPDSWSSDGKSLIYTQRTPEGQGQIWALPLEGERKPSMVLPRGSGGQLSPDGLWLAYQSSESGVNEVYVVAFGGGQGKWQVSANGGMLPLWGKDGREFYYLDGNQTLLAVQVRDAGGALEFGAPQSIVSRWTVLGKPFYDVTPDGGKILLDRVSQQVSQSITVVTNFTADLKK